MPEEKIEKKPKAVSFELTRAEFLSEEKRREIGGAEEGLVVIEKLAHSYPEIKLHYIGKKGIVSFMEELERQQA